MEMFMNKKNLNRIQKRTAKQAYSQHCNVQPFSTISTFRTIDPQKHHILEATSFKDKIPFKIDGFLSFCRQIKTKKNPFDELSRPKTISCQKISKHNSFRETNNKFKKLQNHKKFNKSQKFQQLNKTISYTFSQTVKTTRHSIPKIFTGQDQMDLKNEQFKRRHQSLKNYQKLSFQQITGIEKNTIMSNNLSKLSIEQIFQMKKIQEEKKKLINQVLKTGQLISNDPGQSDQLRQLNLLSNHLENKSSQKLQEASRVGDIFDKKTVEKYQRLLDSIRCCQKYCIESYDDYDKTLTQRNSIYKRRRHNKNQNFANYAQQWR